MKILFVSNGFPPRGRWGTEFYTAQLVTALKARGHSVHVFHPMRDGSKPRYTTENAKGDGDVEVTLIHNPGSTSKELASSYCDEQVEAVFAELLQREQPDLVHFTYLLWGLSVRLPIVARKCGIPAIATLTDYGLLCHRGQLLDAELDPCTGPQPAKCAKCIRTPGIHDHGAATRFVRRGIAGALAAIGGMGRVVTAPDLAARESVIREGLEACERWIAPSPPMAERFARFGLDPNRLTELVYAIDTGPYEVARAEPRTSGTVFGYLGQFTPHKGLDVLLDAVRILSHRLPESVEPFEVRLYGRPAGGRSKLYPKRLFEDDPGVCVKVLEPFEPAEAPSVLAQLDALVLPSLWDENAPLSCLQARSAGVPVIGSDVPGISSVIEDGRHGRLFPVGDALALADAMREAILGKLGRHGHTGPPHDLEEHVTRVLAEYEAARASFESRPDSRIGAGALERGR